MPTTTTTSTTQGPCNNTCPPPDWRDSPIFPPWLIGTSTTTTAGPTPTTTTVTTEGPCPGSCHYDWNISSKAWVKTSSSCDAGCACAAPNFCPPLPQDPASTTTSCFRSATDSPVPNCTGTTSSLDSSKCTTTTTTIAGCVKGNCAGCSFYCENTGYWTLVSASCDECQVDCLNQCGAPGACGSPEYPHCSTVTVGCVTPADPTSPPNDVCAGACRWYWNPPHGGYAGRWVACGSVYPPVPCPTFACEPGEVGCVCDMPTFDGDHCDQPVDTPCVFKTKTTTTLGPGGGGDDCHVDPVLTTRPPDPPGVCRGSCTWRADGVGGWIRIDGCIGCGCATPRNSSTSPDELVQTPCLQNTTTTTTSPGGTTTTTTTTEGPCGNSVCIWACTVDTPDWVISFSPCATGCGCQYPQNPCVSPGQYSMDPCVPGGTTTTTTEGPVPCICQYGVGSPAQGACALAAPEAYLFTTGGVGGYGCNALNRNWTLGANYGTNPSAPTCSFSETATDIVSSQVVTGNVTIFYDSSDPSQAIVVFTMYNATTGDSVTLRYDGPAPIDCCSDINLTAVGGSCAGSFPIALLHPDGVCSCDPEPTTTTTTTTASPSTTTTTTPATAYWCVEVSTCSNNNCTVGCAPFPGTRQCEAWSGSPPTCVGGGSSYQKRVIVSGPYDDFTTCTDICYSFEPTTTTTTSPPPPSDSYSCYSCLLPAGGTANVCILGTPLKSCTKLSGPYASVGDCNAVCFGLPPS